MPKYIDGFIIPVPKKNLKAYKSLATKSGKIWLEHGAIEYVESMADDVAKGKVTSFPRSVKQKSGEVVFFSYVVYKSKAHRNQVMNKVMKDKRMTAMWDTMPFDGMRMIYGGFKHVVSM